MKGFIYILLLFLLYCPLYGYSQQWQKERAENERWDAWAINANAGFTSFYGDLSSYDGNYFNKLKFESGFAMGLTVTKYFDKLFALSGQIISGNLKGCLGNITFKSDVFEYNLHLRLNIYNLCVPSNYSKFGIEAFGGLGNFVFKTTQTTIEEGSTYDVVNQSRVPELVYFVGGALFYQPTRNFAVTTELSIRRCSNDWLDGVVVNDNYDYYSYLNFGITYYLGRFRQTPIRNKARIAHNDKRLKPLN